MKTKINILTTILGNSAKLHYLYNLIQIHCFVSSIISNLEGKTMYFERTQLSWRVELRVLLVLAFWCYCSLL